MPSEDSTSFNDFVNSVGGADVFVWMVMFSLIIIFVLVMAYLNRDYSE